MSGSSGAAGKRWVAPVIYGVLGLELAAVIGFAATYNALDFRIYMWGGHAVTQDSRLYLALAYGHWFTYSPFAAVVFVPIAAIPLAVARVLWDLVSVAALAYSLVLIAKLAGYRPSRLMIAGATAAAMALDPVYETLFLGQINLILLALILTDVWRVSRGRTAGLGVGIAAAIKLTPGIFIVLFLLARRTKAAVVAAGRSSAAGSSGCSSRRARQGSTGSTCSTTPSGSARPTSATSRPTRRRSGSPAVRPTSARGTSSSRSASPRSGWARPPSSRGAVTG